MGETKNEAKLTCARSRNSAARKVQKLEGWVPAEHFCSDNLIRQQTRTLAPTLFNLLAVLDSAHMSNFVKISTETYSFHSYTNLLERIHSKYLAHLQFLYLQSYVIDSTQELWNTCSVSAGTQQMAHAPLTILLTYIRSLLEATLKPMNLNYLSTILR